MLSWNETLIRLALAALFGAAIGLERERKDWVAGMRTHMMVCVGSSLVMMVSAFGFTDILGTDHVVLDPSRIAAQVISGIGFIGAGTILFIRRETIRGLTTAAGLWTVAAIGLATGGGMYFAAAATTLLALTILWAMQPLERAIGERFKQGTLRIAAAPGADRAAIVRSVLDRAGIRVREFTAKEEDQESLLLFRVEPVDVGVIESAMAALRSDPAVKDVTWNR